MYSAEQRKLAIGTYIKFDLSAADTIAELGYPTRPSLKECFPKGRSPAGVTEGQVREVRGKLNRRPRKRLGYRKPYGAITQWRCN